MAELKLSPEEVDRLAQPVAERVWELLSEKLSSACLGGPNTEVAVTRERMAEILDLSAATIDRWHKSGRIPSIGDAPTRRFIVADVLEALKQEATADSARCKCQEVTADG